MTPQQEIYKWESQIFIINRQLKTNKKCYNEKELNDFIYTRDHLIQLVKQLKKDLSNDESSTSSQ